MSMIQRALLLALALVIGSSAWQLNRGTRRAFAAIAFASSLATTTPTRSIFLPHAAFAAEEVVMSDEERVAQEKERTIRKLARQKEKAGVVAGSNANTDASQEDSYAGSLKREMAKQEKQKKSKSDRARDLCEQLGRGC